jgi:hypothetical protein
MNRTNRKETEKKCAYFKEPDCNSGGKKTCHGCMIRKIDEL